MQRSRRSITQVQLLMKLAARYRILLIAILLVYVQARIHEVVIVSGGPGRCGIALVMTCRAIGGMRPIGSLMLNVLAFPLGGLRALAQLQSFPLEIGSGHSRPWGM